jgi:hypothetical protein
MLPNNYCDLAMGAAMQLGVKCEGAAPVAGGMIVTLLVPGDWRQNDPRVERYVVTVQQALTSARGARAFDVAGVADDIQEAPDQETAERAPKHWTSESQRMKTWKASVNVPSPLPSEWYALVIGVAGKHGFSARPHLADRLYIDLEIDDDGDHVPQAVLNVAAEIEQLLASPSRLQPTMVHNHHYYNSGIANVMGPDGVAPGNTNSIQTTPAKHSRATRFSQPSPTDSVNVLIITALKEEYDEARKVDAGGLGNWETDRAGGFEVAFRSYATNDAPLRVALTWATRMRMTATAEAAARLIDKLDPRCLAMCGVCAGRRGKV